MNALNTTFLNRYRSILEPISFDFWVGHGPNPKKLVHNRLDPNWFHFFQKIKKKILFFPPSAISKFYHHPNSANVHYPNPMCSRHRLRGPPSTHTTPPDHFFFLKYYFCKMAAMESWLWWFLVASAFVIFETSALRTNLNRTCSIRIDSVCSKSLGSQPVRTVNSNY